MHSLVKHWKVKFYLVFFFRKFWIKYRAIIITLGLGFGVFYPLGNNYLVPFFLDSLQGFLDLFIKGNAKTNSDLICKIRDYYMPGISLVSSLLFKLSILGAIENFFIEMDLIEKFVEDHYRLVINLPYYSITIRLWYEYNKRLLKLKDYRISLKRIRRSIFFFFKRKGFFKIRRGFFKRRRGWRKRRK